MNRQLQIGFWAALGLLLLVGTIVRVLLGDALTLYGDDHSYYHSARLIVETGDLLAGTRALGDVYSFRYLSTWLTAVSWWLFGDSPASITLFHQMASIGLVILTVLFARTFSNDKGQYLAGIIAALTPISVQLAGTLSPDGLLALFSGAALFALLKKKDWIAGFIFCLSYLCKEESAKHLAPLLVVVAWQSREEGGVRTFVRRAFILILPVSILFGLDLLILKIQLGNGFARIQAALDNIAMWKRMGTLDPEGNPWSWMYYVRRLSFPFGPMAFAVPLALGGAVFWLRDRRNSAIVVWFFCQLGIFILGGQVGQIQDRMLQVLIPVASVFAAYLVSKLRFRAVSILVSLSLAYVLCAKFNLRSQASPRASSACRELLKRDSWPVYADDDIRYYMRQIGHSDRLNVLPDFATLPPNISTASAVVRQNTVPKGWQISEVLFTTQAEEGILDRLAWPIRKYRKEYPPYSLVVLKRL